MSTLAESDTEKNSHCKQSLVITMMLKALTCCHMIVIMYDEGVAGGDTTKPNA